MIIRLGGEPQPVQVECGRVHRVRRRAVEPRPRRCRSPRAPRRTPRPGSSKRPSTPRCPSYERYRSRGKEWRPGCRWCIWDSSSVSGMGPGGRSETSMVEGVGDQRLERDLVQRVAAGDLMRRRVDARADVVEQVQLGHRIAVVGHRWGRSVGTDGSGRPGKTGIPSANGWVRLNHSARPASPDRPRGRHPGSSPRWRKPTRPLRSDMGFGVPADPPGRGAGGRSPVRRLRVRGRKAEVVAHHRTAKHAVDEPGQGGGAPRARCATTTMVAPMIAGMA